jgi:DNA-binding NarL/FixJ family response regulator
LIENIRCLIADIPHFILADIIQQITEKRPGIEVVCHIEDVNNVPKIVQEHSIDVVILGEKAISVSQSLDNLFDISPQTVAVGVINEGRRVCVCVEDIGPSELIKIIKSAVQIRASSSQIL